jgi:hypothetical protein
MITPTMLNRRRFLQTVSVSLHTAPPVAEAQPTAAIPQGSDSATLPGRRALERGQFGEGAPLERRPFLPEWTATPYGAAPKHRTERGLA